MVDNQLWGQALEGENWRTEDERVAGSAGLTDVPWWGGSLQIWGDWLARYLGRRERWDKMRREIAPNQGYSRQKASRASTSYAPRLSYGCPIAFLSPKKLGRSKTSHHGERVLVEGDPT
uniref:Uncharacterized protein n=1 Tax=Coccidioides posadasii RMSCC 3488 TaxID=454284 RepID=A0A0J6FE98_COCPO|nr:hypothetical protein CPAG_03580 [Coccidioides posadasii RMSCC 3488]